MRILKLLELEKAEACALRGGEQAWDALGTLAVHLEDQLVLVEHTRAYQGGLCNLMVCRARDSARSVLYVLVSGDGEVRVGRVDDLERADSRYLDGFDPLWHGVVSVTASALYRPLGDRLDLWILVRPGSPQQAEAPPVAYHGLIWVDEEGNPRLDPSRDDQETEERRRWMPHNAEDLPELLRCCNFVCPVGTDALADKPSWVQEQVDEIEKDHFDQIEAVTWAGPAAGKGEGVLGIAVGGEVVVSVHGTPWPYEIGDRVRALALVGEPPLPVRGVAAPDARLLVAFEGYLGVIGEAWRQSLHEFPVGVAFLSQEESQGDTCWPDILVALHDGDLQRLRWVGRARLRSAWDSAWRVLGLNEVGSRISEALAARNSEDFKLRQAALLGVVESMMAKAETAEPEIKAGWAEAILELFRPEEPFRVLARPLELLLETFEAWLQGKDRDWSFPAVLLYWIYTGQSYVAVQDRINAVLRSLPFSAEQLANPAVKVLKERSAVNRNEIWGRPEPQTSAEIVERAVFGLERWANAYLLADTVQLERDSEASHTGLAGFEERGKEGRWILCSSPKAIRAYPLLEHGSLDLSGPAGYEPGKEGIQAIVSVPGSERMRLLVVGATGNLYLLAFDPESNTFSLPEHSFHHELPRDLGRHASPWAVACSFRGHAFLAVAYNERHQTRVRLLTVEGDRLRDVAWLPLDIPRVRALDLVGDEEGGFLLAAGSYHAGPVRLVALDGKGRERPASRWFRVLKSGTLSIRFSSPSRPTRMLAGERSGLLWCADPGQSSGIDDLVWTYDLGAAVRAIEAIEWDGEPHFLAGGENGKLVLLRARDGRRVWKHSMGSPVRHIRAVDARGDRVVVAMRGQRIALLSLVRDQKDALKKVRGWFEDLGPGEPQWGTSTAEPVEAIFRLAGGEKPLTLLSRFSARETRALLVRYLAGEIGTERLREEAQRLVRALSLRELMLLLSYLPESAQAWNESIWDELSHKPLKAMGDDSVRAGMAAVVAFLQRLRGDALESFFQDVPVRNQYLEHPWVRLELARIIIRQVERSLPPNHEKAVLLAETLPWLLRHPPSMVEACVAVLRYGAEERDVFSHFGVLVQALERNRVPKIDEVVKLAQALKEVAHRAPLLTMMSSLASLFAVYREERSRNWTEWRREALENLRGLERSLRGLERSRLPLKELVTPLRRWLADPMPQDQETVADRSAWLRSVRRRLDEPLEDQDGTIESSWDAILRGLALETKRVLDRIIRLETEHVFLLVRPFLHLEGVELQDGNKAQLRLRVEPEGSRSLEDVTVRFDASGPEGFHGAGASLDEIWVPSFPSKKAGKALVFSGYLREGQESLVVETNLRDRTGYQSRDRWVFQVPRTPVRRVAQLSFAHLVQTFQVFLQSVLEAGAPLVFAVIDADLGRDRFIEEWTRRTKGEGIPLDDLLRDIGPRRRYSALRLNLEMLERCLEGQDPQEGGPWSLPSDGDPDGPPKPLLVAPVDELLSRLLEGEEPGLLETWLGSLRQRARVGGPPLVMVLSSLHAARLRGLSSGEIVEVAAHRALFDARERLASRFESLRTEILSLVENEAGLAGGAAEERLESLGWDLRLALLWLRWLKEDVQRKNLPLARFLEEAKTTDMLRAELQALSPMRLVHALVGAEAVTTLEMRRVVPGQVSDDDHFSTSRTSTPKLLQRRAQPFTERSLQSLQSDQRRSDRLRVQGLGFGGTMQTSRSQLLSLARHPSREEQERSFQALASLGIGSYVSGIFRTRSPYRELIQALYDKAAEKAGANPDESVYGDLMGRERSWLESLTMAEVATIPLKQLSDLLAGGQGDGGADGLRKLKSIAQFWKPDHVEDVEPVLARLFAPGLVHRIHPQAGSSDEPIARLPWPVFGVFQKAGEIPAGEKPQEYVLWIGLDRSLQSGDLTVIGEAADAAVRRRPQSPRSESFRSYPRILALGPGADSAPYDETRRVAILKPADLCHAAWSGKIAEGIRRRARVQMRITALSPFQTSGALPAGSPLFVGREDELSFIKAKIRSASILIIGSRRVGKTSLLNQVDLWAQGEPDLEPVFVDLQGCTAASDFVNRLRRACAAKGISGRIDSLDDAATALQAQGRLPLFLLNEIDGLVEKDPGVVVGWRGLNDRQRARFLMVGYTAIGQIGSPSSPFFHFTEGPRFGGKALVLDALSEDAARKLLDLLESSDVQARWVTPRDREQSYRLCLDRSYRIPWVLQRYGQLLVEHLERERKDTLSFQDVETVVEHEGRVVWRYIEGIDYKSLDLGREASASRPGFQLVLYAVARQKYFLGGRQAPVLDPRLAGRSPLSPDLGFTIGEARDIVKETLSSLLRGRERSIVSRWFEQLDLERAFRLLTLTLMLEPDPEGDRRYGFLLHILPKELWREHGQKDPTLDGLIVRRAVEFMQSIVHGEKL